MSPAVTSRARHWLMLAALVMFLLLPSAVGVPAIIAAAGVSTAISAARLLTGRRSGASEAGVTVGIDAAGKDVLLSERQLAAHGLILGASGAGKTTTLLRILTDRVARGLPVVAIDMKGSPEFARTLADAAAQAGRQLKIWTPDGPTTWNPLQHGNPTELKDKLIATERFTEPHYQRAAERYVQTVLQVLHHAHPDRAVTLDEVARMMDPHRLPAMLRGLPQPLNERVRDYLAGLTPDQLSAIRGLGTRLALITESQAGQFLEGSRGRPSIDLHAALRGGDVVLFSLNSSVYGKLGAQLGTLAVQDLVSAVGHRLQDPPSERAMIAIDEFSALGADHVIALLARAREAGVTGLVATQELADLDRAAPGLRDQVLGNTAVKIAHRQDVPSSAQTIAEIAGTETTWEETRQVSRGLFGTYDAQRGTRRQVERFVVHPNDIKGLRTGQAVVITKIPTSRTRTVRITPSRPERGPELG